MIDFIFFCIAVYVLYLTFRKPRKYYLHTLRMRFGSVHQYSTDSNPPLLYTSNQKYFNYLRERVDYYPITTTEVSKEEYDKG